MIVKISKLITIILAIFCLCFSIYHVYAGEIDMNVLANNDQQDPDIVDNTIDSIDTTNDNAISVPDGSSTYVPVNNSSSSGLTTSNIINIILIAVGVILILLAVAILFRLSK